MKKTNAMRILQGLGIAYEVHSYSWDEQHLDAMHASASSGLAPQQVYKTIVMENTTKEVYVFCIPATCSVSIKKARKLTGSKDIDLISMDRLLPLTGYKRGGCSPLGMRKQFPTFVEELALLEEYIYISAGVRGLELKIAPTDLVQATGGVFATCT